MAVAVSMPVAVSLPNDKVLPYSFAVILPINLF